VNPEWKSVVSALLGSWPQQVAAWGREALAAYIQELQARGIDAEQALIAIRSCGGDQKFPPSAPELAALARHDPDRPTFEECYQQLYGPGGIFGIRRTGAVVSPWVEAFADTYGRERIRMLEVEHEQYGDIKRRDLQDAYARFLEASEGRAVAQIARSGRGGLGRLDALEAIRRRPVSGALPGGSER
jgi:hypothetical protein